MLPSNSLCFIIITRASNYSSNSYTIVWLCCRCELFTINLTSSERCVSRISIVDLASVLKRCHLHPPSQSAESRRGVFWTLRWRWWWCDWCVFMQCVCVCVCVHWYPLAYSICEQYVRSIYMYIWWCQPRSAHKQRALDWTAARSTYLCGSSSSSFMCIWGA